MANDLHKDHRERVRKSFLAQGFDDTTPDHKVLEMLLFYSIPRKDTNEIAHMLLNRFGTLAKVIDGKPSELKKISGIGDNSVALFKLVSHLIRHYEGQKALEKYDKVLRNDDEIFDFIIKKHMGFTKEVFAVTSFSAKGKVLAFDILSEGDISSVAVSTRELLETAMKRNAVSVVISHNHPDGNAVPSPDDLRLTQKIARALSAVDINLIDHVITADNDCVSIRQTEEYKFLLNK